MCSDRQGRAPAAVKGGMWIFSLPFHISTINFQNLIPLSWKPWPQHKRLQKDSEFKLSTHKLLVLSLGFRNLGPLATEDEECVQRSRRRVLVLDVSLSLEISIPEPIFFLTLHSLAHSEATNQPHSSSFFINSWSDLVLQRHLCRIRRLWYCCRSWIGWERAIIRKASENSWRRLENVTGSIWSRGVAPDPFCKQSGSPCEAHSCTPIWPLGLISKAYVAASSDLDHIGWVTLENVVLGLEEYGDRRTTENPE